MANVIKNQLYPHTKKYINEYLHGFSKDRIDIQLTKGEVTLEKLSLRPDTINKMMDEKNIPFWIKVGLIKKISLGASLFSVIGEIPLEIVIEGVDIILSPSYKWIIQNIDFLKNNNDVKDTPNPLGNDIFNKKPDEFDTSIFNVEKIQEIFKDKTVLSNVINSLFNSFYKFYTTPNFAAVIKIKNVHLRFEDDELMNYTGDIALGVKINLLQIKLGCKGNMKKDSIKLESLDVYWENDAKILISSNFLNGCIKDGLLQERYYTNLKNVRFEKFEYLPSTKFIVQDFNMQMNLGTRNEKNEDIDIFNIKTTPSMVYMQLATNELNINLYPEIAKIQNNFMEFLSQFPIIEKVKDYHPFIKPTEKNSMDYINLMENYRKNVIDNIIRRKMLVREWMNYFYWFQKSKKGEKKIVINPIRTEFVRFYNICIKKVDIAELKKGKKKKKVKKEKKEDKKVDKKEWEKETPKGKSQANNLYIAGTTPMGDEEEKVKEKPTPGGTPFGDEKETPTPGETPEGDEDEEEQEIIIPKELQFSVRIDLLIKGVNVNLHSPLDGVMNDYISLSIAGIETKIRLTEEKFDFTFKIKTIDLGPSNLHIGQRIIIQPKSYRKAIPEQNMTSINSNIPYGNLSTYNYVSLPNSNLGSGITGLIKKYNPNHEQKIKVIDEALELAESNSRVMSLAASELDGNKIQNKLRNKTPFGGTSTNNLGQSAMNVNVNMTDLGKTYGSVFVPRNVSFAKNLIDNYEGNSLQNKIYEKKKNNELNISQAINDYNSYKNQEKKKIRTSRSPPTSLASSNFNLRESVFGIMPNTSRGKNIPLNLLEIFSNTEVGALSMSFTKYNNPVTIDNFSIQIGTIRLNMFTNYLLDMLRILSEYKKATSNPKITTSEGDFVPDGRTILEMQEYFYNYLLKKIPDSEKTDSMIEYMEYLRREIYSKKKFSSKPEHFTINTIFSFFPKGFEFHFDYENIEVVAYDKENAISSKIIIPSSEVIFHITLTKIYVKLLELEIEISDLNKCETIIENLKELAKDKFKVVQIIIEPCYRQVKDGIEPLLKDENKELKEKLKEETSDDNINQKNNINVNQNSPQNKSFNQNTPQNKSFNQNSPQNKSLNQNSLNENSPRDGNMNRNNSQYQNYINDINMNRNSPQSQNMINYNIDQGNIEEVQKNNLNKERLLLLQRQKEEEEKKKMEQQFLMNKQQEQNILKIKKENELKQQLLEQQQQKLLSLKNQQNQNDQQIMGNQLHPNQKRKNLSQNNIGQPMHQSLQPEQQRQGVLLIQKEKKKKNKSKPIKYVKKAGVGNNSKKSQIPKPNEEDDKIPTDTLRTNKRFIGSEKNGNSIYINTNDYNLSQMQREHSSGSYQQSMGSLRNLNPQIQQEFIGNNTNTNDFYYNAVPANNNAGYPYQNYYQNSYALQGNNNQAIASEYDSFHLLTNNN